ncbi:MAG: sodium ion-translocating decarboxylase subunit beta [Ruminococcus sp.]|jgi:oxaloacetate decarboxylase beta subunit|nr:sodium ion-translocating decarboxylase subunit beta [Ruminococcus sp.]
MKFSDLFSNLSELTIPMVVMWLIGGLLIYLAIKKDMEPSLLLPIGFGAILTNLPMSGAVTQLISHGGETDAEVGVLDLLFNSGIANELFPLLLFIGIGAMIDFGPLISNPKMLLFGAAAQFGIFFTFSLARFLGFGLEDSASISIIGAADGPTSIFVANYFNSNYIGAIIVAAYSYMALVPIVQPPVIKLLTTKKERRIKMPYTPKDVSKTTKILMPIVITIIAGLVAPRSVALVGFLMFGNLIRECGVLNSLSETAQKVLANLVTLMLGITVAAKMQAHMFLNFNTLMILALGLIAFIFDTAGGVIFAKVLNLFLKKKVNPMVGAAGISAFPMSSRVINKMGIKEDPTNFLLMHAAGANVAGQVASVIAGGLIITLVEGMI